MATASKPGGAAPWTPISALQAFQRPYIPEPANTKCRTFTYDDDNGIMCDGFRRVDHAGLEALFLARPTARYSLNPRDNPSARWTTAQLRLYGIPFGDGACVAERWSRLEVAVRGGGVLAGQRGPSPYMVAVERRLALEWERRKQLGSVDVSSIQAAQFAACAGDPGAEAELDPLRFVRKYFLDDKWRPRWPGARRLPLPTPPPATGRPAAEQKKAGQSSLRKAMFINRIMKGIRGSSSSSSPEGRGRDKATDQGTYNYFHDNNVVVIAQRLANEATLRAMVRLVPRLQMHVTPRATMLCWDASFDAAFDLLPSLEDQADLDTARFLDRHFRRRGEPDRAPYKTPWPVTLGPSVREETRARLAEAIAAIPGLCVAFAPSVSQGRGGDASGQRKRQEQQQQQQQQLESTGIDQGRLPQHDRILAVPSKREARSRGWEFPPRGAEARDSSAAGKARIDTIVGWERRAIVGQARAQQMVVERAEEDRAAERARHEAAWAVSTVGHVQLVMKAAVRLAPPIPPPKPAAGDGATKLSSHAKAVLQAAAAKLAPPVPPAAAGTAPATSAAPPERASNDGGGGGGGGGRLLAAIFPRQLVQAPMRMLRRRPNMATVPAVPGPKPKKPQKQQGALRNRRLRLSDLTGSYIVRCETLDPGGWHGGSQRLDVQRPVPALQVGDLAGGGRQRPEEEGKKPAPVVDLQDPATFFFRPRPPSSVPAPGAVAAFDFGGLQGTMVLSLTRAGTAKTLHFLEALERARRIRAARARRRAEEAVEARRWELIRLGEGLIVGIDDVPYDQWVHEEWARKEERDAVRRARRERREAAERRRRRREAEKKRERERARARKMYGRGSGNCSGSGSDFGMAAAAGASNSRVPWGWRKLPGQQQQQQQQEEEEDKPDPKHPGRVYFQWAGRDPRRDNMIIPDVGGEHVGYLDFEPTRAPAGAKVSAASAALVARGMMCLPVLPSGQDNNSSRNDDSVKRPDLEEKDGSGSKQHDEEGADGARGVGDYQMVPISVHKVSGKPRRRAERWENFSWRTYWNTYGRWQGETRGLTAWKTDGF